MKLLKEHLSISSPVCREELDLPGVNLQLTIKELAQRYAGRIWINRGAGNSSPEQQIDDWDEGEQYAREYLLNIDFPKRRRSIIR